jgi:hypothetical protein
VSEALDTAIRAQLLASADVAALVADRIYRDEVPQDGEFPCIVFFRSGGAPIQDFDGPIGTDVPIYEFQSLGYSRGEMWRIAIAVADALNGWRCVSPKVDSCSIESEGDGPDVEVPDSEEAIKTVVQTFQLWTET